MPSLSSVQSSVDTAIGTLVSAQITTLQTTFFTANSRYFQGIMTTPLASMPNNTTAGLLQNMTPNLNQAPVLFPTETFTALGLVLALAPYSLEIIYYFGPGGKGYVINSYIKHTDKFYLRQRNVGPENYREQAWVDLTPPPLS